MAADASRVGTGQIVIAVHVTLRALHRRVRPRQRETGRRVIKGCGCPGCGRVALLTGLREIRLHMVRLCRTLEILQVAAHARRVRAGQVVVIVHVALRTLHRRMRTSQREPSAVVIECRVLPRRSVVALLAGLRKPRLHVIGIGSSVEVLDVARRAVRRCAHILSVHVTLRASDAHVRPGQRELRESVVIEGRRAPRRCAVALLAGLWEARLGVWGIARLVEVWQMTTNARRRRASELSSHVAGGAIQGGMRSRQGKAGKLQVIELCAQPVVHAVTLRARRRKIQRDVARGSGLVVLRVTAVAVG